MASKRSSKPSSGQSTSNRSLGPLSNALLLGSAVCYGLWLLIERGKVSWPPSQLMASLYTLAGCLALVGPIVLARSEPGESSLGELLWMTGGLMIWIFDALALAQGSWQLTAWATPVGYQTMGLTMLAVLLAGWRCRISARGWGWTNVTGWLLGLFWVGLALSTFLPSRGFSLAAR